MSGIAIGTYVKLIDATNTDTGFNFQNFFQGEERVYNGDTYIFGGFGFSGGTLDLEGGNISAGLVFAVNDLSLSVFKQAAEQFWLVRIRTVWLDPDTFEEGNTFSEELYAVTGFDHDSSRLSVRLSSPLDAVQENAPRRTLTADLVGALPSTGQISLN
jgi:hypothetical protein